ncbi:hypothetical protein [Streptomyces albipurpureus]|uniref:DUF883 domain-containing protein n=1 Tax=Streptomyces albipurpureus TaxID=2897419 RepID=A0ABT0V3F8_9ACTN|nr:hypothetical protein [Streptomyces sp. CWNU-1]MCM2394435.1 hypothetical protein [Streptomyces sp. CWNU-1]
MTPPETAALTAEMAHLRGDFAGFGRDLGDIKTACAVLVERSTRTEQDLRDLRAEKDQELRELREEMEKDRAEVAQIKARQWPLQPLGALTAIGALGVSLYTLLGR